MTHVVLVAPEAEQQIRAIDAWWRANRPVSPDLFGGELREGFATLRTHPGTAPRAPHPTVKGLRRLLLPRTKYHIYYVPTDRRVLVLAVWSAVRGSGPELAAAFEGT